MTETEAPGRPSVVAPSGRPSFTLRVGTSVQTIDSIEASIQRHGRHYLDRMFTPGEVEASGGYGAEPNLLAPGLAARLCAKEAVLKVLRPLNIVPEWRDIEIVQMPGDWVGLNLTGSAQQLADEGGLTDLQVSFALKDALAVATVIGVGGASHEHVVDAR